MGVVQLSHIKSYVVSSFSSLIDLSDIRAQDDREAPLLTRGLAAMALEISSGISHKDAADAVTDGYDDGGIDAIYHDAAKKEVTFVQSKWSRDGKKTIDQGDCLKFINGIERIIRSDFSVFNDKIKSREADITKFLLDSGYAVIVIVVHVSDASLPVHVAKDMGDFIARMNDTSDLFSFKEINQRKIHSFVKGGGEHSIDLDIDIYDYGMSSEGRKVFYGKVSALAIAEWKESSPTGLFDKNIRTFLGDTNINALIVDSLRKKPSDFLMLNNGVTILCGGIDESASGAGSRKHRRLHCSGAQVVNGAQTVGACHKAHFKEGVDLSGVYVMSKIIEVGNEDGFAELVTRATNTQNKIERKDFVSLDEIQKNLRISFSLLGVDYLIKSGEVSRSKEDYLSLEDATIALIVQKQDVDLASLAKREIGKIWENLDGAHYTSLFNSTLDVKKLWKVVQILREIDVQVNETANEYGARGKGYAIHGNIFMAMQVYKRLDLSKCDSDDYDDVWFRTEVRRLSALVFVAVFNLGEIVYSGSYLAHLFRNAGKCRDIASRLDSEIADLLSKSVG